MLNSLIMTYPFLRMEIFYNHLTQWLNAVVVFILMYAALKIFKFIILVRLKKLAKKTKNEFDDVIVGGLDAIHWPFNFFIAIYVSHLILYVSPKITELMSYILLVTVIYYIMRVLQAVIDVAVKKIVKKRQEMGSGDIEIIHLLSSLVKIALWVIAILLLLANFGYNITSLITGLGIGGIAVALALQNILSDIFSSFSIYFDKPFSVGDFVIIGDKKGTVKRIGIKSTRIQSLDGEELVMPNTQLTQAEIKNYGLMERRRIAFNIGVVYGTPKNKLEKIPLMIQQIIDAQEGADFDRAHFKEFGDFSKNFEIVYYVNGNDYAKYMNIQQSINLAIESAFAKEKIGIAFPTQTIHLAKE